MQIEIMKDLGQFKEGQIVTVKDKKGIPCDIFWRRRLEDAELDGCVKIHKKKRSK